MGVIGVGLRSASELLRRCCGLLQRAGLRLGAAGQVLRANGNLGRGTGNGVGAIAHLFNHFVQTTAHFFHLAEQLTNFIRTLALHLVG